MDTTFLRRATDPNVFSVKADDIQLLDAIQKAKLTIKYFKDSLENSKPHQTYFAIKTKLTDGSNIEHIWLDADEFSDNIVYGTVNNVPANLKNIELGKKIGIPETEISDWLIIENNRLIGGYTIRTLRDKMSRPHRELFESSINFTIDNGIDYFEPSLSTPEGAIVALELAYEEENLEKAIECKDFFQEAKLMALQAMKLQVEDDSAIEVIEELGETLKLSFIKHLTETGFPKFSHLERAFIKKEKIADNMLLITETFGLNGKVTYTNRHYCFLNENNEWKVLVGK